MQQAIVILFRKLAPALFVLLWSTGFIGAKLGLPYAPPFTFLALRMAVTVTLLISAAALLRLPWPRSPTAIGHLLLVGMLSHAAYLGGVFSSIRLGVPAGTVALITGLQPILTALLAMRLFGETVSLQRWGGLALGLIGVGLVVGRKLGAADLGALVPVTVSLAGITLGTLYQKRFCGGMNLVTGTAVQYTAAGSLFAVLAFSGETMQVGWTPSFVFALLWLSLVLSVGAVFLLYLMIRQGEAARVTSLFYLTPPTTAAIAWLSFGEQLTPLALAGFVLAALGVTLARR